MLARVFSCAVIGLDGVIVEVEVDFGQGLPHMAIVEAAQQAMRDAGVTPRVVPIRGGTDGARLSYEGLPCPNLFTGGENYHGRFEYVPVEDMEAAVRTLKCILRNAAK